MKYFVLVAVGILTLSQEISLIRVSQTTGEVSTIRIRLNFLKIVTLINQMLTMFNTTRAFKNCLGIFLFAFVEFLNSKMWQEFHHVELYLVDSGNIILVYIQC